MDDALEELSTLVREADSTVALTGAGVSTASGIPSFRGEEGIWATFDPMAFHRRRLDADPAGFWADRLDLRNAIYPDGRPEPNAAHEALATLEADNLLDAVLTQNVDGLHSDAGSQNVIELHGNNRTVACDDCGMHADAAEIFARAGDGELPPRCDCGGVYRPAVVLFGEELPDGRLEQATAYARESDCFLAVGSSLQVRPAARLPEIAATNGATVAVVNFEETPRDVSADIVLREDVTSVLPAVARAVVEE